MRGTPKEGGEEREKREKKKEKKDGEGEKKKKDYFDNSCWVCAPFPFGVRGMALEEQRPYQPRGRLPR